ncbi:hypothetical protein N478_23125 [Pseudoalteromonas luteoviolacea S4060-1]|uniref:Uncharacterized protein n=1 Tax=Pseudoalteromonas luteoviolacea S4060-1 TaxID=1365257 RepID=A0A167LAD1_9GAMM|nr:hypothetical protein N478_23125 [Pseudoalteromonas luteoviolacea S4060-1]
MVQSIKGPIEWFINHSSTLSEHKNAGFNSNASSQVKHSPFIRPRGKINKPAAMASQKQHLRKKIIMILHAD